MGKSQTPVVAIQAQQMVAKLVSFGWPQLPDVAITRRGLGHWFNSPMGSVRCGRTSGRQYRRSCLAVQHNTVRHTLHEQKFIDASGRYSCSVNIAVNPLFGGIRANLPVC
jgi:hypothetical protein